MSLTIIFSILIRLIATGWSIVLLKQTKDWRMAFLSIMFAFMALRQIMTVWSSHESLDHLIPMQIAELPGLIVSIMAFLTIFFLQRVLTERKQAEEEINHYQKQLRILASEITIAEEEERRRIAIELHDHIIQDLGLCKIKLGDLTQRLSDSDCKQLSQETRNLIEKVIKNSRTLVFELSLPILYELGLEAAIKWLVGKYQEKFHITYKTHIDDQHKPLEKDLQVHLFKAVRELFININKHAHANEIIIYTTLKKNEIIISIKDDGVGFNVFDIESNFQKEQKFGLFGIKERLRLLNGSVTINSSPGAGTNITISAPLEIDSYK